MVLAKHSISFQTQNLGTLFSTACDKLLILCLSPHRASVRSSDKNVTPEQATSLRPEKNQRAECRVSLPIHSNSPF